MSVLKVYADYDWKAAGIDQRFRYCPHCARELQVAEVAQRQRATCPACGYVHYRNPAPAVGVLLVDHGRVFLGQRAYNPGAGLWALLSGYVEYDEDFLSAARREVREETDLEVELHAIVNVESAFLSPTLHFLAVYLLASPTGGVLALSDELTACGWFPLTGPLPSMAFRQDVDLIAAFASGDLPSIPLESAAI
ncbi:MAG: NUDIX hydrolase [Anaerolineales bacterium]|nr:NUDIX hydrolase [Anaerolineales bacterium]